MEFSSGCVSMEIPQPSQVEENSLDLEVQLGADHVGTIRVSIGTKGSISRFWNVFISYLEYAMGVDQL